jgi:Fe-S cluster assembly protein SufD
VRFRAAGDVDTKVIFVDGKFSSYLSSTTHDGLDVLLDVICIGQTKYKMVIDRYFEIANSDDSLTSLNTAFLTKDAYVHIPKKVGENQLKYLFLYRF